MVLHGKPCGRVGRRRDFFPKEAHMLMRYEPFLFVRWISSAIDRGFGFGALRASDALGRLRIRDWRGRHGGVACAGGRGRVAMSRPFVRARIAARRRDADRLTSRSAAVLRAGSRSRFAMCRVRAQRWLGDRVRSDGVASSSTCFFGCRSASMRTAGSDFEVDGGVERCCEVAAWRGTPDVATGARRATPIAIDGLRGSSGPARTGSRARGLQRGVAIAREDGGSCRLERRGVRGSGTGSVVASPRERARGCGRCASSVRARCARSRAIDARRLERAARRTARRRLRATMPLVPRALVASDRDQRRSRTPERGGGRAQRVAAALPSAGSSRDTRAPRRVLGALASATLADGVHVDDRCALVLELEGADRRRDWAGAAERSRGRATSVDVTFTTQGERERDAALV